MISSTTWRAEIASTMEDNGDTWEDVESAIISGYRPDSGFDRVFDGGYGGTCGDKFLVHTENHVYYPCTYDGMEWCGSVPRNPTGKTIDHQGGQ